MKVMKCLSVIALLFLGSLTVWGNAPSADEIVRGIDDHRLISDNSEMMIRVDRYLDGRVKDSTVMRGQIVNGRMTMLTFLAPDNMKGRKIAIKDGEVWLIVPTAKNPIHITANQRLVGGISYGDVAGVSYAEGYAARWKGEEPVTGMNPDGSPSETRRCNQLELTAKTAGVSYDKIVIWAEPQSNIPVKADFFALSGKKMTTVYYTAPKEVIPGKTVITKMFLVDQINTGRYYAMEFYDFKSTP